MSRSLTISQRQKNIVWSVASVVLLIAGIGALVWAWSFFRKEDEHPAAPEADPITSFKLTPSQKALGKYLFIVVALFTLQVFSGRIYCTLHR